MPNFDGKGPLKRGRVIGRGRGSCAQDDHENRDMSCNAEPEKKAGKKAS